MDHTWTREPLTDEGRRSFDELLPYCFPEGDRYHRHHADSTVVCFAVKDEEALSHVKRRLDAAYERCRSTRPARRTPLLDQPGASQPVAVRPENLVSVGPGLQVARSGTAALMRGLDNLFLAIALELGAEELALPHLVSWATIEAAGYPRTFPQHLTTCQIVRPDIDALDRFAAARTMAERVAELSPAPVVLAPAACLHVFAMLAGHQLQAPLLVTGRAACARHEPASSPSRLWSFTMREIVFVGDAQEARATRQLFLDRLGEVARELELPCVLGSASDPFFTHERAELSGYQKAFDLKHELRARMPDGTSLAVSSVNLHKQHFGTAFDIASAQGAPAQSVCLGFGLERWALWVRGYWGDDPERWPQAFRRFVTVENPLRSKTRAGGRS